VRQELDSLYDLREHVQLVKEKLELVIEKVLSPYRRSLYAARAVAEAVIQAYLFSRPAVGSSSQP
jgi:hypothetical protein